MANESLLQVSTELNQEETKSNCIAFCTIKQQEFLILRQFFTFVKTYS